MAKAKSPKSESKTELPKAPVFNPAAEPQTDSLEAVPSSWPGGFGLYKYAKSAAMVNIWTIIGLWALSGAMSVFTEFGIKSMVFYYTISIASTCLFAGGLTRTYIAGARRQTYSITQALNDTIEYFVKFLLVYLVVIAILAISLLLLIVPFFFVAPRLALVNYFVVDKKLGVSDALKASWDATQGHVGKVYGIIGATFVMVLPFITFIGIPLSIYLLAMYSTAFALLYEYILREEQTS